MARETKWCQNPKCPEKKNSNQIRGMKGEKYYQSNRANGYGNGNFCTLGCQTEWDNIYMDRAIDALNIRITEPVKVDMENAWVIDAEWQYRGTNENNRYIYFLVNDLYNIRHPITRLQATINPAEEYASHKTSAQAKELAQQLGLTNQ
jgi:hypothetical protein